MSNSRSPVASQAPPGRRGTAQRPGDRRLHRLRTGLAHCRGLGLRRAHAGRLFRAAARRRQDRHRRLLQHGRAARARQTRRTLCRPASMATLSPTTASAEAIDIIRRELAPLDLVIYSLASPKRTHPRTGVAYNSALKPIGQSFSSRTIELDSEKVVDVTLGPANEKEIADTIAVMGGRRLAHVDRGFARRRVCSLRARARSPIPTSGPS